MFEFVLAQTKLSTIVATQGKNVIVLIQNQRVKASASDHDGLSFDSFFEVLDYSRGVNDPGQVWLFVTFTEMIATPEMNVTIFVNCCTMSLTCCNLLDSKRFKAAASRCF